ncbi:hypothetical protein K474DRAFT_285738 [Panus rudis PR-1116 ss-1]|nr:hypothetical protein K474DRAFT_285738 [Panus rudis PR-1116 ss-1]
MLSRSSTVGVGVVWVVFPDGGENANWNAVAGGWAAAVILGVPLSPGRAVGGRVDGISWSWGWWVLPSSIDARDRFLGGSAYSSRAGIRGFSGLSGMPTSEVGVVGDITVSPSSAGGGSAGETGACVASGSGDSPAERGCSRVGSGRVGRLWFTVAAGLAVVSAPASPGRPRTVGEGHTGAVKAGAVNAFAVETGAVETGAVETGGVVAGKIDTGEVGAGADFTVGELAAAVSGTVSFVGFGVRRRELRRSSSAFSAMVFCGVPRVVPPEAYGWGVVFFAPADVCFPVSLFRYSGVHLSFDGIRTTGPCGVCCFGFGLRRGRGATRGGHVENCR